MKKGFTLIELLAVILILGIIALIAIPTVNNILDESRRGAFKTTTQNVLKQAEETCMMENIKGIEATKTYTITDGNIFPKLDLKGELPDNGTIILDGECQGKIVVNNNKYCGKRLDINDQVSVTDYDSSTCVLESPYLHETAEDTCFVYEVEDETISIVGYDNNKSGCAKTKITIPTTIDNKPVSKIGYNKYSCDNQLFSSIVTEVDFSKATELTTIEEMDDFQYCSEKPIIKTFDLVNTKLTSIELWFGQQVLGIENIKLPSTITSLHEYTFAGSLKTLYIDKPEGSIEGAPWGLTNTVITYKQG